MVSRFIALRDHPGRLSFFTIIALGILRPVLGASAGSIGDRRALELPMSSAEMDIPFLPCAEEISNKWRVEASLLTCWRENDVQTAPEMALSLLDEHCSRAWFGIKRGYWSHQQHLETTLCMSHKFLVGWHSVEILSIIPASHGGLYPV